MKIKLKILKENKSQLNESRYKGLYDIMGVYPGSLDIFIKHFVENPIEVSKEVYDMWRKNVRKIEEVVYLPLFDQVRRPGSLRPLQVFGCFRSTSSR